MVSGINSLAATHEQVFVGWTGDIEAGSQTVPPLAAENTSGPSDPSVSKIPSSSLAGSDRVELEGLLQDYRSRDEIEDGMPIHYVPVFVEDKDAHGHYDGYCKQSECIYPVISFPFVYVVSLPFIVAITSCYWTFFFPSCCFFPPR